MGKAFYYAFCYSLCLSRHRHNYRSSSSGTERKPPAVVLNDFMQSGAGGDAIVIINKGTLNRMCTLESTLVVDEIINRMTRKLSPREN